MLSWDKVIRYVKGSLATPSDFIEMTDDEIQDWIILKTIPTFSEYYPDEEYTSVIVDNTNYQHESRQGNYLFFDEDDLDIVGITDCYFSLSESLINGHPEFGAFSFEGMKWWSLSVFRSRFFAPASNFRYSYKFYEPNIVQVLPVDISENFVVKYEREQPHDLRRIPASLKNIFMNLALADVKIKIGQMRASYGDDSITTPFGTIPLRGEIIRSEGDELRRETLDLMEEDSLPGVVVDVD